MRALESRRPQLPAATSFFHRTLLPPAFLPRSLCLLLFLLLVARGGEPLPSRVNPLHPSIDPGPVQFDSSGRGESYARETGETVASSSVPTRVEEEKKEEEVSRRRRGDEEAEGAVKKRRRNDVGKSKGEEEAGKSEGIRRFDEGAVAPPERTEGGGAGEVIPNHFRKSGKLEEDEEEGGSGEEISSNESSGEGREYRYLAEGGEKSKNRRSSTVYLNAEERRVADGEQQSIVDGQIKRLISIRDDALDARTRGEDKMDEAKVLNFKREVGELDGQRGNEGKGKFVRDQRGIRLLTPDTLVYNILQDALETYQSEEPRISYIDINNDTLKKFMTTDQLYILRMAEKFLPQTLRLDYSEKMFSCVRRFEYYSCVKHLAWPLIKQYFPALPPFPDSQTWYPIIDMYPVFPPFPVYLEGDLVLPEVVDEGDGKTGKRNGPEATIIQILQNVLKDRRAESSSTHPSSLDRSTDAYIALIPDDQLLTIDMAERLIPISYRARFVEDTVRCMKEYDYLACFKFSAWPTVKRFVPALPDIFAPTTDHQSAAASSGDKLYLLRKGQPLSLAYLPSKGEERREGASRLRSSDELEVKILDIVLAKVRDSVNDAARETSTTLVLAGNARHSYAATFTNRQIEILRLAEYLVPPSARPVLIADVLSYLRNNGNFIDCARHVIWPTIAKHVPDLPDFPREVEEGATKGEGRVVESSSAQRSPSEVVNRGFEERVASKEKKASVLFQDKESRNGIPGIVPVISVSGTRFVPIFTELPETIILNILRTIHLQSLNSNLPSIPSPPSPSMKNPQFLNLLTEQQTSIVNLVDTMLPSSIRPDFANKMIDCLRKNNNFLVCTRDVAWPMLMQYFPWLPNFPNFGIVSSTTANSSETTTTTTTTTANQTTEIGPDPPLSETNVKTGQHGDTTVTITDTRFVPILNELPETIILNILKAVQLSLPNLPASPPGEEEAYPAHLTEHQIGIMNVARNLLPSRARAGFNERILPCLGERNFLECTRDVTWPAIAQTYPWLPNFPNFNALRQTSPRVPGPASISFQFLLDSEEKSTTPPEPEKQANGEGGKLEEALLNVLGEGMEVDESRSYLNASSGLNERQIIIARRIEGGIPEAERSSYATRMLDCSARYSFATCVNNVGWPILKRYNSSLPDLSTDPFTRLAAQQPRPESSGSSDASQSSQSSGISQGRIEVAIPRSKSSTESSSSSSRSGEVEGQKDPGKEEERKRNTPTNTPSVDNEGIIPEYAGQPTGIPIDISSEKVHVSDVGIVHRGEERSERRERRSAMELHDTDHETTGRFSPFPNITESEYLRLLVGVKEKTKSSSSSSSKSKQYLVDSLNSTIRDSLTADQYEILKIVEDLDGQASPDGKGLASQTMNCILSFSFIRCLAIFVWPLIASNFPTLGILGRSMNDFQHNDPPRFPSLDTEKQMQEFFAMSTTEFEKELLKRKESIERFFLDLYRVLTEGKFETSIGYFKIKGNDVAGSSSREGRGAKLKDNKNLPSILTIISDIMEEVLDQRPEGEKAKKEKEKRERSIEGSRESDVQLLKDGHGYIDIKRSMNDDEIITMFLDKIKSNDSDEVVVEEEEEEEEGDQGTGYLASEDAYNAFEVLFGTKLHDKASTLPLDSSRSFESSEKNEGSIEPIKRVDIVSLESRKRVPDGGDESKLKDQVAYDFEKELSEGQEERRRKKRAKAYFKSFLERYSSRGRRLRDVESVEDNAIDDENRRGENDEGSRLIVRLPRLRDVEAASRKGTAASLSKGFKSKMSEMMPGFGLVLSFLLQLALAHARATASVAGMISNMALGTAMFGMVRDSLFGTSSNPKIKYVYDNDKTGPGISWPAQYEYAPHYYG